MDGNNPAPKSPEPNMSAVPQPAAPQIPIPNVPTGDSNKMVLWLVIGLVVIIVLVGGIYLFLSRQQTVPPNQQTITSQVPSPSPQENLEGDLNGINVDAATTSADFTSVDQDLQQL